jgi:cytochrome c biogenesis factor
MWFRAGGGAEDRLELAQADLFQARIVKGVFFLLLVGLILGAAWGDVAWGRWWGWDPKETWAFVTWLVYAIVIHVRLITRDRGVVTAVMSAWGFGIMLFTWFGTNYGVTRGGLHSYSGTPADEAGNVVPLIWAAMTVVFPITGSFLPGGLALGAYAVSAARKRADSPVPRILNMAAVCAAGFTVAVFVGLYWRYGATPGAMWDWVCRSARTPIDAAHVLTTLDPETAGAVLNPMLFGLWLLVHATLSLIWGAAVTALSRKAPAS